MIGQGDAAPFLAWHADGDVRPLSRRKRQEIEPDPPRQGLGIDGEDLGLGAFELQLQDARDVGDSDPQPYDPAARGLIIGLDLPVGRAHGAECPRSGGIAWLELTDELTVPAEPPVAQIEDNLGIEKGVGGVLDHHHPSQTVAHLLQRVAMGMIPERAGVGRGESIVEASARRDVGLGEKRHPVHRVRNAQPMPMDRRRLVETIDETGGKRLTALQAQNRRHGAGRLPIGEDGLRGSLAEDQRVGWLRLQFHGRWAGECLGPTRSKAGTSSTTCGDRGRLQESAAGQVGHGGTSHLI